MAARRDGDVVDLLEEDGLVELCLAERLSGELAERVLVDAVVSAGVRGGAGVDVVLLAGGSLPGLPAVVVSAVRALDLGGEAADVLPRHGVVAAVGRGLLPGFRSP